MAEQQASYQEILKISEEVLKDVLDQIKDGKKHGVESKKEEDNNLLEVVMSEQKQHTEQKATEPKPTENHTGPKARAERPKTKSQSSPILFPSGFNHRMRRYSVSAEPMQDYENYSLEQVMSKVVIKDSETRQRLLKIISQNILFKHLNEEQLDQCVDIMFEKKFNKGDIIIRQGIFFVFLAF